MKSIYVIQEEVTDYEYSWTDDDYYLTYSYNPIYYTDSLEDAKYIVYNFQTSEHNPLKVTELHYLNKDQVIQQQRYYRYEKKVNIHKQRDQFVVTSDELKTFEQFSYYKSERSQDFNHLRLTVINHGNQRLSIHMAIETEHKKDVTNTFEDLIQTIETITQQKDYKTILKDLKQLEEGYSC